MATLSEKQAKLFTDRNWGVIATVREDGSPHVTPVWIDYDGEDVLVNSARGRTKVKNVERDPRATVTVLPAADQQSGCPLVKSYLSFGQIRSPPPSDAPAVRRERAKRSRA